MSHMFSMGEGVLLFVEVLVGVVRERVGRTIGMVYGCGFEFP